LVNLTYDFLYCFDKAFNTQASIAISSLLHNVSSKVNIHIIHKEPETFADIKLRLQGNPNLKNLYMYKFEIDDITISTNNSHLSEATYYRLFMSKFLSNKIQKLVYLDADIVCVNNPINALSNIFDELEKENKILGAREEIMDTLNLNKYKRIGLKNDSIFNAGVLIIDYKKWLEENIDLELFNIFQNRIGRIKDYDQEILNLFFENNYLKISTNFNYPGGWTKTKELIKKAKDEVYFIHYLGKGKPWFIENIINNNTILYQEAYRKLGVNKYHLTFDNNSGQLKKFFKLLLSLQFLKLDYPLSFLNLSFTAIFKNIIKSDKPKYLFNSMLSAASMFIITFTFADYLQYEFLKVYLSGYVYVLIQSYTISKFIVFKSKEKNYIKFIITNILFSLFGYFGAIFIEENTFFNYAFSYLSIGFFTFVIRYLLYKNIIFKNDK